MHPFGTDSIPSNGMRVWEWMSVNGSNSNKKENSSQTIEWNNGLVYFLLILVLLLWEKKIKNSIPMNPAIEEVEEKDCRFYEETLAKVPKWIAGQYLVKKSGNWTWFFC